MTYLAGRSAVSTVNVTGRACRRSLLRLVIVVPVRIHVLIGSGRVRSVRAAVLFLASRFRRPAALGYEFQLVFELALERHLQRTQRDD